MKMIRRWTTSALIGLFSMLGGLVLAAEAPHRILVILSDDEPAYRHTFDTFKSTLTDAAGPVIPFEIHQTVLREGSFDADAVAPASVDLVIPVGARAARFAKQRFTETPLLNILITREAYASIWPNEVAAPGGGNSRVSALYLEQPIDRQFRLMRLGLPDLRHCSILISERTRHLEPELRVAAQRNGIELHIVDYSRANRPVQAFQQAMTRGDALLVFPDPEILSPNHAKWLLFMAYQQHMPVIGFSRAIVDAGALVALYTSPEQVGRQAAEQVLGTAVEMLDRPGASWRLPPPRYPEYFQVAVNQAVARAFDIETRSSRQLAHSLHTLEQSDRWQASP